MGGKVEATVMLVYVCGLKIGLGEVSKKRPDEVAMDAMDSRRHIAVYIPPRIPSSKNEHNQDFRFAYSFFVIP